MFRLYCLTVVIALAKVPIAQTYKNNFGKCPQVYPQPEFDIQKLLGNWYVIEATSTSKRCLTHTLTQELGNPDHYLLTESFPPSKLAKIFGASKEVHRTGLLTPQNPQDPGVFNYKHPSEILRYKYTVLKTDYDQYALIYVCKKMNLGLRRWSVFILSRTPTLKLNTLRQVLRKLVESDIQVSSLSDIDHTDCKISDHADDLSTGIIPKIKNLPPVPTFEEALDEIFTEGPATATESILRTFDRISPPKRSPDSFNDTLNSIFRNSEDVDEPQLKEIIEPEFMIL